MNPSAAPAFLDAEIQGQKREIQLAAVCRLGRSVGNDLVLDDESVSRNHALVYSGEVGVYYINDLGSSNGTFVNGLRVSAPMQLKDGDTISLGSCGVRFRQKQAPPPQVGGLAADTSLYFAQKLITVLVTDIRGFTVLAQHLDPAMVTQITGTLFREAGAILRERGAWGQKYIGDAVMAVWLHSGSMATEMASVLTALAGLARIAGGLQRRFGLEHPIRIGAGINTGLASLGNVGSAASPDHTASGDTVNRAFRLESATKEMGWDLLLGAQTYESISPFPEVRGALQHNMVMLRGYSEPVAAWGARFQDFVPAVEAMAARSGEVTRKA